ncbi:MAG: SUMF1/EgtB/PvdO family nonheme iron enzyme [Candidatus Tectomicrobia bacterium]|uniref:SUMF1/EgtB/PvdO family nonheme iron enzyme n=1 Tax=Tectimicrobiota bacterium TaxID=2528274 RepID=A0A932GND5_UNCTE|nr:SUMF1/EgtB/PvdO family nonheme iron enzyme [Candidatus Tectomicrobia bacterium]
MKSTFSAGLCIFLLLCTDIAGAQMVRIPAGEFLMGSDSGPSDERPTHRLFLPAFEMDRLPVTNAEFADFLNAVGPANARGENLFDVEDPDARIHRRGGRWGADAGFESRPVVEASWAGARDYCAWAGKRLPTEAEWEKAARGTDGRRYPWGNEAPDAARARFAAGWNETAPVGNFPRGASPYGILDMSGNAWEWVNSAYRPYPYRADDGREELTAGPVRGTRGGGHDSSAQEITTTQRGRNLSRNPRNGHHNIGFRCAR